MRRKIALQCLGLLSLSAVLGATFNAANPIGIHTGAKTAADSSAVITAPSPATSAPAPEAATATESSAPRPSNLVRATASAPAPAVSKSGLKTDAQPSIPEGLSDITWEDAKPLVSSGRVLVVDVRGKETYEAGHIPGAISLPGEPHSTPQDLEAFKRKYGEEWPLLLYCSNHTCEVSHKTGKLLHDVYGFKTVLVLKNGYAAWQKAELGYDPTPTGIKWAEAKPLLGKGEIVLVDSRPKAVYDAGHIPGAISLPEKSPATVYQAFQKKYGPDTHIVVYCADLKCPTSVRTASKLAMWYNFRKVQYMYGGYLEWQKEEAQHRAQ